MNGTAVGTVVMDKGMALYPVPIQARVLRPDFNEILFRYRYATSPAAIGASGDSRQLAMQCDSLRLTRHPTNAR